MSAKLRSKILNSFQLRGFSLRSDASKYLLELLEPLEEDRRTMWINNILTWLQEQRLESALVSQQTLAKCIQEWSHRGEEDSHSREVTVVDAFQLSPLSYSVDRKKFLPRDGARGPKLFGDADSKAFLFQERYCLVLQKTARHPCFATKTCRVSSSEETGSSFELRNVEQLLGTISERVVVLGMLTQFEQGKYFLEDPTGSVAVDVSKATFTEGLFTESSFVLAEGLYEDSVFRIEAIGLPPVEPASETLKYLGSTSVFSKLPEKVRTRLEIEDLPPDAMMVFLSDVWLDSAKVLDKLRVLFAGYSQAPPTCFVLAGNFLSRPMGTRKDAALLAECFKKLANLVLEFPQLLDHSQFVLLPGPMDPGLSNILPRPGLPRTLVEEFTKKVSRCHLASNPCRLLLGGREVVLFREDGVARACRNALHLPWQKGGLDVPQLYTKCLASNAHLCPLNLGVSPVYWEWDFALWLLPLPDAVALADSHDPFSVVQGDCLFFNPGSFPKTDFSFKVYLPGSRTAEDSQISEDPF